MNLIAKRIIGLELKKVQRVSSGSYWKAYVICPMYIDDDGRKYIKCEGIVDKSYVSINFRHKRDFEGQMEIFCCKKYENCETYRMLMRKYEE